MKDIILKIVNKPFENQKNLRPFHDWFLKKCASLYNKIEENSQTIPSIKKYVKINVLHNRSLSNKQILGPSYVSIIPIDQDNNIKIIFIENLKINIFDHFIFTSF